MSDDKEKRTGVLVSIDATAYSQLGRMLYEAEIEMLKKSKHVKVSEVSMGCHVPGDRCSICDGLERGDFINLAEEEFYQPEELSILIPLPKVGEVDQNGNCWSQEAIDKMALELSRSKITKVEHVASDKKSVHLCMRGEAQLGKVEFKFDLGGEDDE